MGTTWTMPCVYSKTYQEGNKYIIKKGGEGGKHRACVHEMEMAWKRTWTKSDKRGGTDLTYANARDSAVSKKPSLVFGQQLRIRR